MGKDTHTGVFVCMVKAPDFEEHHDKGPCVI